MSLLSVFRGSHNYLVCIRCHYSEESLRGLRYSHTARYAVNTLNEVREMVSVHKNLDQTFGSTMWKPIENTNVMVFDRNNRLVKWVERGGNNAEFTGVRPRLQAGAQDGN